VQIINRKNKLEPTGLVTWVSSYYMANHFKTAFKNRWVGWRSPDSNMIIIHRRKGWWGTLCLYVYQRNNSWFAHISSNGGQSLPEQVYEDMYKVINLAKKFYFETATVGQLEGKSTATEAYMGRNYNFQHNNKVTERLY